MNRTFDPKKKAYFDHISRVRDNRTLWRQLNSVDLKTEKASVPPALSDPGKISDYFINSIPQDIANIRKSRLIEIVQH